MITINKTLSLLFVSLLIATEIVLTSPLGAETESQQKNVYFTPPDAGKPNNTTQGGTRPVRLCANDTSAPEILVTALVPDNSSTLTTATHPTFLVYLPPTTAENLVFSLRDPQETYYYQQTIQLDGQSGIISFTLPENAPPLEVDQDYLFSFTLACEETISPDDFVWSGNIRRVTLTAKIDSINSLELASFYGENGIWLDMLALIAQEHLTKPNDLTISQNWQTVLESVGLEEISEQPLLE
ncbi:MAG: DUF928 domain-containing protein [Gloeocapsa sp. DLM2.Bin57]|nr:MAG: DUF928 domain-containing protein [Gloeocapsa sp. DLM2.Bin57]